MTTFGTNFLGFLIILVAFLLIGFGLTKWRAWRAKRSAGSGRSPRGPYDIPRDDP